MSEGIEAKLALACNILAAEGHSDLMLGHISARMPGAERVYIKASGLGLEEITPADIIVIDLDGNQLAGKGKKHLEFPIHTEVYRKRPDVCCVIHTHPPYATALAATRTIMRPLSHEGVLFSEAPVFRETGELILNEAQGRAIAECLGDHRVLLIQNHGVVVVGATIEEATVSAALLEKAARIQWLASMYGELAWSPPQEVELKLKQIYNQNNFQHFFAYYVRRLQRMGPQGLRDQPN